MSSLGKTLVARQIQLGINERGVPKELGQLLLRQLALPKLGIGHDNYRFHAMSA